MITLLAHAWQYRGIGHQIEMASDGVGGSQLLARRRLLIADGTQFVRAARRKDAAAMRCGSRHAGGGFRRRLVIGGRSEQHLGIGVVGRRQHLGSSADLADPAAIHHRDPVR
jgi:hypothetical protein